VAFFVQGLADPACEVVESGAPAPLPTAHHRLDDDEHLVTLLHHICGLYSVVLLARSFPL